MNVNVDLIGAGGRAQGSVANEFLAQGRTDVGTMRPWLGDDGRPYVMVYSGKGDAKDPKNYQVMPINTNATLRRDEWKTLDDALMLAARQRLGGAQDLIDNGLVYNLGNAMGTTVLEWHDVSDSMEADLTMDGVTRSIGDRPKFQHNYLPIPIIHVDYEINARILEASRKLGNPLDTTSAEQAARRCLEKLEDMFFTNTSYAFGETDSRTRHSIYSYLSHPDRNQITLSSQPGGAWDNSSKTAAQIVDDVRDMKQSSINDRFYGPWMLYIPTAYETILDADYAVDTPGTTIRERILKIDGIKGVKVVDRLTADNVLLVQMTSNVVRLVQGMGLQNVEWQTEGKFVTKYKVMTIQVPQIRSDQNGRTGIVHMA